MTECFYNKVKIAIEMPKKIARSLRQEILCVLSASKSIVVAICKNVPMTIAIMILLAASFGASHAEVNAPKADIEE